MSAHPSADQYRREATALAAEVLAQADFKDIQALGWHFQRKDFYSPLNDAQWLWDNRDLWHNTETPLDIDWNLDRQIAVAAEVGKFTHELRAGQA